MGGLVAGGAQVNRLTEHQVALVQHIVAGMSHKKALEAAGYAPGGGGDASLRSPAVQAALKAWRVEQLHGSMAVAAINAIKDLITSYKTPAATRLSAIKWVLEQAGHGGAIDEGRDVPLHEMTAKQLATFMAKAQAVIDGGGEAPIISVTPEKGV